MGLSKKDGLEWFRIIHVHLIRVIEAHTFMYIADEPRIMFTRR